MMRRTFLLYRTLMALFACVAPLTSFSHPVAAAPAATGGNPTLSMTQTVSAEPLLGGEVAYLLTVQNSAPRPVDDRGFNLTVTDTLPLGLSYLSAEPAPQLVEARADGTTQITWANIADLEAGESLPITLTARLESSLTLASTFINTVGAKVNSMPDNSGQWISAFRSLNAHPQAIDIEAVAQQSTAGHQATGAGEYALAQGHGAGADWPYTYRLTVRNNKLLATNQVEATAILPPGVAYLGNPTVQPLPNGASATSALTLQSDGSLKLRWSLMQLGTDAYNSPVVITFDVAVPYKYRTVADTAAQNGPFAGPMSGAIIPEDTLMSLGYEATGSVSNLSVADGTQSTPDDDAPAKVTADVLTIHKSATPEVVGIGDIVDFDLDWYVSEYYDQTGVQVVDTLPDGMTYVASSASLAPVSVDENTPEPGQTRITWQLADNVTTAGASGTISFQATVDPSYQNLPYDGAPVVSGDRLTNEVTITGDWHDVIDTNRNGTTTPDSSRASVDTRMPTFTKEVWDAVANTWRDHEQGFTGDTLRFRLQYASAPNVDARSIVIRDFLPRGMTYVSNSAQQTTTGSFSTSPTCTSAPTTPTVATLDGLQFLEWRLCNTAKGSTWEATIEAKIGDIPNVQPDWIVANFGKLSGANSLDTPYSQRALATVDYAAPKLVLTKSATPNTNLEAGNVVQYTISVANTGRAAAYNLVVRDLLPADVLVANSGGNASPGSSSYTTLSGDPASGQGGTIQWSNVAALAAGATQTYRYSATIPQGLPSGAQMTNVASVAYNSRADSAGHQWNASNTVADDNTDDETIYLRGMRVTKSANPSIATIGEVVHWTLTGTLPPGQVAYWPALQENSLPEGFDYIPGSTVVNGATLDTAHHAANPLDNGDRELRWFLQTLDNTNGTSAYLFTLSFDTLVTGVKGTNPNTTYYPNNCCLSTARNSAYVGWYDDAGGYNNQGFAYDGFETNRTDRRSPRGGFDAQIRQPNVLLNTRADHTLLGAGETLQLVIEASNLGNSEAYDLQLADTLPAGLSLLATQGMSVRYPANFPGFTPIMTDTNQAGATSLGYAINTLHVGATWAITLSVQVDPALSAGLNLTNKATVTSYSSRPGVRPDSNGDGLADERAYSGPTATLPFSTPAASVVKQATLAGELTYGAALGYSVTVPATPINAWIYNATLEDAIDTRLTVENAGGATATNGTLVATLGNIPPNQQRTVVIGTRLAQNSTAHDGDMITNVATLHYDNGGTVSSNSVAATVVAPALVVSKIADKVSVNSGERIGYTVTVQNVGHGEARNVSIADTLPAGAQFVAGSAHDANGAVADPVNGAWSIGTLAGGAIYTIQYQVEAGTVSADQALQNNAVATGQDSLGQAIPANNSGRVSADSDPDDRAVATVYGPLAWTTDSVIVAYEDLKKFNWSDWDYNDFVVRISTRRGTLADGSLAALEVDYTSLARGAGFLNHDFRHTLPLVGGGWYALNENNALGAGVRQGGQSFDGDEPTVLVFGNTRSALPQPPGLEQTNTLPTQQGVVPGYTSHLMVALNDPLANSTDALPPLPWDPFLHITETGQEIHLVQPGHLDNTQTVTNKFDRTSPLIGYDLPLAHVFADTWRWPSEFNGIWRGYPTFTGFIKFGGTRALDWYESINTVTSALWGGTIPGDALLTQSAGESEPSSRYFASPTVADLNGDGRAEIIIGNMLANQLEVYDAQHQALPGWPQAVGGAIRAAATVADLDGDGRPDVLVGASDGKLYAWNASGAPLAGWPVQLGVESETFRILAAPAVGDIDGDGRADVLVPLADGRLYALNADGTAKNGWPVSIGLVHDQFDSQISNSSPRIADLDGDGTPEIVVGSTDGAVYAFGGDGAQRWRFASGDMILGAVTVAELDARSPGREVIFASGDRYVYLLDAQGGRIWRRATGWTIRSTPVVADLDGDSAPEIIVGGDDNKLWAWHSDGSRVAGWPRTTSGDLYASPSVGDIDGDGDVEVVVGSDDGSVYAWHADGAPVAGWPRSATQSVKGSPALANLDDDPALEVIVGDMGGELHGWGMPNWLGASYQVFLPVVQSP